MRYEVWSKDTTESGYIVATFILKADALEFMAYTKRKWDINYVLIDSMPEIPDKNDPLSLIDDLNIAADKARNG